VLALLRPDLKVTLLEPRARRWAFLREAVRQLSREDVSVERSRGEDYRGPSAETVTMRAVGWSPAQASALLKRGGDLLIFGGQPEASGEMTYLGSHPLQHQQVHVFRRVQQSDVSRET
jgi:16S rRNA (guanine527-N7)-methyltransferase